MTLSRSDKKLLLDPFKVEEAQIKCPEERYREACEKALLAVQEVTRLPAEFWEDRTKKDVLDLIKEKLAVPAKEPVPSTTMDIFRKSISSLLSSNSKYIDHLTSSDMSHIQEGHVDIIRQLSRLRTAVQTIQDIELRNQSTLNKHNV